MLNNEKENKEWGKNENETLKDLLSKLNGVLVVEGSSGLRTVLRKWGVPILIAVILVIALAGWVQAIRNSATADGLLMQLEVQKAEFERQIQEKDIHRAAMEKEYQNRLQVLSENFKKSRNEYVKRKQAEPPWKEPKNIVDAAHRFRARGLEVVIR